MLKNLSAVSSLVSQYVFEIRDQKVQSDRLRFRRNLERLGEIAAYEISKTLDYNTVRSENSLGSAECSVLREVPVLATILRAGLPMHQGLLNFFDGADNAFISAYRKHSGDSFEIELEYCSCPSLDNRTLIITDPMLATAASMILTLKELRKFGNPQQIHVVSAIASNKGVDALSSAHPGVTIWTCALDQELNAQAYIVPGLGDAGDLAFGDKLQR